MQSHLRILLPALAIAAIPPAPATAQDEVQVFRGATVLPIAGPAIESGVLVVRGGAIVEVGGPDVPTPPGAVEHDLTGRVLLPGLVDSHSHVGAASGGRGAVGRT